MTGLCRIITGDCRQVLPTLEAGSVNCCVTSPPYWGLRDYGVDGQIGLEASFDGWISEMVAVFREVRRVLADSGTLWLNCGDAYAGNRKGNDGNDTSTLTKRADGTRKRDSMTQSRRRDNAPVPRSDRAIHGYKPKDLIGMPWRLAFALQADGWYLRKDIIWHKPNPMPESCKDRPTTAHEYIFLMSKSPRYYYDADAIVEPCSANTHARVAKTDGELPAIGGAKKAGGGNRTYSGNTPKVSGWASGPGAHDTIKHNSGGRKLGDKGERADGDENRAAAGSRMGRGAGWREDPASQVLVRNSRSVWTMPTEGYDGAHYATFPRELARRCILAGCPAGGLVLDPFGGTGTTGEVALKLGRRAVLIELNPEYAKLALERIGDRVPLFAGGSAA
ncbi:MAG: hypothetical protein AMXMBFR58_29360 [Phycisphaerae bacterium]